MNKTDKIISAVIGICVLSALMFMLFGFRSITPNGQSVLGDSGVPNIIRSTTTVNSSTVVTNASSTVSSASTLILATSTARQYAVIVNDSINVVYLSVTAPAAVGKGIRLNANGGIYEIDSHNLFVGSIYGIASTTSNVTVLSSQE